MIEVEIKIKIDDLQELDRKLRSIGAECIEEHEEIDTYYQHPCRDFRETDEALRVRIRNSNVKLTYKGPKLSTMMKTRKEFEVSVSDFKNIDAMLKALGFKEVAKIRKHRRFFIYNDFKITLDSVNELGYYIEVEKTIVSGEDLDKAEEEIRSFITKIGLRPEESILKSYLELYLERRT